MKRIGIGLVLIVLILTGCSRPVEEGTALLEQGKYEQAAEIFEKEIESHKHLEEAYRGLGIARFELEQYEEAGEALEEALRQNTKETATIYSMLGACYLEQGECEKALESYKKALELEDLTEEQKQEIQWNLIAAYENMGDWDGAKEQMNQYREDYPDDEKAEKEAAFLETR